MYQPKDGEYYFRPHRRSWGVWKCHIDRNGIETGEFISDFSTKIQASEFVRKMNKW